MKQVTRYPGSKWSIADEKKNTETRYQDVAASGGLRMMGLMIHEREELERLRVCVVEQAAAIERLDDEIRKNKETARDAMGLVEIAKKQQPRGPTLMGIARPLTLSICCVGQLRK